MEVMSMLMGQRFLIDDLPKANIKYVITTRNLQREFLGSSIEFEKIYNSDVDGIKIYKVLY